MGILSEALEEYFKNTPREQVIKDWESTREFDEVNSPLMDDFLKSLEKQDNNSKIFVDGVPIDLFEVVDISPIQNDNGTNYWFIITKWNGKSIFIQRTRFRGSFSSDEEFNKAVSKYVNSLTNLRRKVYTLWRKHQGSITTRLTLDDN